MIASLYLEKPHKRFFDVLASILGLIFFCPLYIFAGAFVAVSSGLPVLYFQKRVGKNGKIFEIIKFRTMIKDAEELKSKYKRLNQADGPVFKIYDDPRFTKIGKILSKLGLDELPQLINVLKGEMSLVGPRPLPIDEAKKLTKEQKIREMVRPGITSTWVIEGSHRLSFKKWMQLDKEYVESATFLKDLKIIIKTVFMLLY